MNLTWNYGSSGRTARSGRRHPRRGEGDQRLLPRQRGGEAEAGAAGAEGEEARREEGELVGGFAALQADGTTSCGNWLYCQSYNEKGNMMAAGGGRTLRASGSSRVGMGVAGEPAHPLQPGVVDLSGKPYNVKKAVIYWNANAVLPTGSSAGGKGRPDGRGPDGGREGGEEAVHHAGRRRGSDLRAGLKDGPFPEHYEPLECPVQENLMSKQRTNPASKMFSDGGLPEDVYATCDTRYPYVATTYR